jgi:hypothetical protein
MRCAACNVENPPENTACAKCGAPLARRSRRRGVAEESDSPFARIDDGPNRRALVAYRFAVCGLIPGVGLIAGPFAVILGCNAWVRDRKLAGFSAWGPLHAALMLGALCAVTNSVGLALVALSLR